MLKLFRRLFKLALWAAGLAVVGVAAAFVYFAKDLPDPQAVLTRPITQSTKIYDRTGQTVLYEIHGEEKRTIVKLEDISPYLRDATLAAEDHDFYEHYGIRLRSLLRAVFNSLTQNESIQGTSTITQQFIKNSLLSAERSLIRKIKEAILAVALERRYSKDEILGFYLNQIPYGSNAYGAEAAAETFFNKKAGDLTLNEAAVLAALPKAPSYLSPYGSHPDELQARRQYILNQMAALGYITDAQRDAAKNEKPAFAPQQAGLKAPHFVFYVRDYLESQYGQDAVETGGLKVTTTLDWPLEQAVEQLVMERAAVNEKRYNAGNAAAVVLDTATGQILAMVGSRDYFDLKHDGNVNVVTRLRQPGSAFKPFAYAKAFEKGYPPDTILYDLQTVFLTGANENYLPENYDGRFRGPVTMRQGLAQSLNVPSVKTLYLAGIEDTIQLAERLGITSLKDRSRFDLALVLGGAEVTPLEMAAAYTVFAAEGVYHPPVAILKVEDAQGAVLETYQNQGQAVLAPQVARLINSILSDNAARAPVFGEQNPLTLPGRPAAAKTGTTQKYRDAWTVGYTPQVAAAVWTGNNDNTAMYRGGAGVMAAGPLWQDIMLAALKDKPAAVFTPPEPIVTGKAVLDGRFAAETTVRVDKISGKLATALTPPELVEERVYKEVHDTLYYVKRDDPRGAVPAAEERDPAFKTWEPPVQQWVSEQPDRYLYNQPPPAELDDVHTAANKPTISITAPTAAGAWPGSTPITMTAAAAGPLGIKQVDFFFDDQFVGTDNLSPYSTTFLPPAAGEHVLAAKAYDQVLNVARAEVPVTILGERASASSATVSLLTPAATNFPYRLEATVSNLSGQPEALTFYFAPDETLSRAFLAGRGELTAENRYAATWWSASPLAAGGAPVYVYAWLAFKDGALVRSNVITVTPPAPSAP